MQKLISILLVVYLSFPAPTFACIWDYDTIMVERNTFPTVNELIAGYFVRHSKDYYQWRIEDRTSKKKTDWTTETFDDIAVAYDKLSQSEKAIETILEKQRRFPDEGQYETAANLGTFLIHAGRLEEGLEKIKAAIEINPDAHFGRERYQQLLVEFMLNNQAQGLVHVSQQFDEFVLNSMSFANDKERKNEIDRAIKGVSGMMRFGNFDSPILLSTLGDLLNYGEEGDAKRLAARAYLKAAQESSDTNHIRTLREKATQAIELQVGTNLKEIEGKLGEEIEAGKRYFAQITADEQEWINAGLNVDENFKLRYYMEPKLVHNPFKSPENIFLAAASIAVGIFLINKRRKLRQNKLG